MPAVSCCENAREREVSLEANFLDSEWPERLRRGVRSVLKRCGVSSDEWVASGLDVHHIIAAALEGARPGRVVLERWGVGVHSVANAAIIPRSFHQGRGLHRLAFLQQVNQRLVSAEMFADALMRHAGPNAGRLIMVQTIQKIGNELVLQSGDGVAIRLQAALQGLATHSPKLGGGSGLSSRGGVSATERNARKQGAASAEGTERTNAPLFGKQRFGFQSLATCS